MIRRFPLACLLIFTLVCFIGGLWGTFVLYDDDLHIFRNPIMRLPMAEALRYYWSGVHKGLYIPATYTVWTLLVALVRPLDPFVTFDNLSPVAFHGANLCFHLINVALLWNLTHKFSRQVWIKVIATALFAIHPLQVESVAWATGLKDILAGTFALLAMTFYWRGGLVSYASVIFFLLSVLSKPAAIVLPAGMFLIDVVWKNKKWQTSLLMLAPWGLLVLPLIFLTSKAQPLEHNAFAVPFWLRFSVMTDALLFYASKVIFPYPLIHDYGRHPEWVMGSAFVVLSPLMFLGAIFVLVKRRAFMALSCLALFFLWILPVSGLVQFAFQNFSTVADHYVYFPLMGVALSICILFRDQVLSGKALKICAFMGLIFGGLTMRQVLIWKDSPSLLSHTIKHNPHSVLAHNNFGVYYEWIEDWEKALQSYHAAYESGPRFTHHLYNLGNLYMRTQRLSEAESYFHRTLAQQEKYPDAHFNLGLIAEARGDLNLAQRHFEKALEQEPTMYSAAVKLAGVHYRRKKWDLARFYFELGIELNPLSPQAHLHYGRALKARGMLKEAEVHFRAVQSLDPIDKAAKNPKALLAK